MSSPSGPRHAPDLSLRSQAFSAAAAYRIRYPSADARTVAAALRILHPALQHRPQLVAAAAAQPPPSPQSVAVSSLTRLRSRLIATAPGGREVQRLSSVVVQHFRAATSGEAGGSIAYSSVLVSQSRCAWWWGVSPAMAGRALRGYLDDGTLRLVGMAGRTRRVALAVGSPERTGASDLWLDPAHPVWSAVEAAYANRPDQDAWAAALLADDLGFELTYDSAAMDRAEVAYRERAESSRQSILSHREDQEAAERVRRIISRMPKRGAPAHRLDAWMRAALSRAPGSGVTDRDRGRLMEAIEARGHSGTVATAVAKRVVEASESASTKF